MTQPGPPYPPPALPPGPPPGLPLPGGYPLPPARTRRRRWPWIVAVLAVVIIAGGALHLYFARTASSSPRGAVDHYWSALVSHNADKAQDYICRGRTLPQKDTPFGKQFVASLTGYQVGAESGSGKTRVFTVTARLSVSGRAYDFPLQTKVVRQWNGWFVCDGA